MMSFPPHCSHKLHPLDVGVYGPFKNYMNRAQGNWMINYPGKTMTIYDLPALVKESLSQALNPSNIMNGFKASGLWPFNDQIFPILFLRLIRLHRTCKTRHNVHRQKSDLTLKPHLGNKQLINVVQKNQQS